MHIQVWENFSSRTLYWVLPEGEELHTQATSVSISESAFIWRKFIDLAVSQFLSYLLLKHALIYTCTVLRKFLDHLLYLLLFSRSVVSTSLWPHGLQHARLPCPSPSPRVCSNSCPLSQWCHPTISSSVAPFFSCPQSCRLFASGGQSIEASASASVLPVNIQGWFPLGLTSLISLLSKGLSGVFSSCMAWFKWCKMQGCCLSKRK